MVFTLRPISHSSALWKCAGSGTICSSQRALFAWRGVEEPSVWESRSLLRELFKKHSDDISFAEPSNEAEIADAAEALGTPFPDSLRCALSESNGIQGKYEMDLLWSVSRIVNDNKSFRTNTDFRDLYMPFDSLLFFGDAGSGDQFAFVILNGEVRRRDIFVWNHECDSRSWIAPSLETFYEWLLTGKIDI